MARFKKIFKCIFNICMSITFIFLSEVGFALGELLSPDCFWSDFMYYVSYIYIWIALAPPMFMILNARSNNTDLLSGILLMSAFASSVIGTLL